MKTAQLRAWRMEDQEALVSLCSDISLRTHWMHKCPYPYTLSYAYQCITYFLHANPIKYLIYAIVYDDVPCGCIQCVVKSYDCAELSYWLKPSDHNQDALEQVIHDMCHQAFYQLPISTIYARTSMQDAVSSNALMKNGFEECRDTAPIYLYFLHRLDKNNDI